jgi:hypothetical protein
MKRKTSFLVCAAISAAISSAVSASIITTGDLLVYRVGISGGGTLASGVAASVYLDDYSPTGSLIQTFALPDGQTTLAATGQNNLTASGTASSEGLLSIEGNYVAFTGYGASNGTAGVVASSATRVVGILNITNNVIDTSTALTNTYLGNNIRGAVYDGTNIYTTGASNGTSNASTGGVQLTTLGATTSTPITYNGTTTNTTGGTSTTATNFSAVNIVAGQLYASSTKSPNYGINLLGASPTSGNTPVTSLGVDYTSAGSGGSPYEFLFSTLPGVGSAPMDEIYVADGNGNDILKYSLVGGSYVASGKITGLSGITGVTGEVINGSEVLYATTPSDIYTFTDTTGYNGTVSGSATVLIAAPSGESFRGIVAVPEPASIGVAICGGAAMLLRRRRKQI